MRLPSVMNHQYGLVPGVQLPRSAFNRSHGYKTTFDSGYLVPFFVDEALPGDTFSLKANLFSRLATPIVPIMDNMFMETFFFAVPYRLVWDSWKKFNGEQKNPSDSTDYLVPELVAPVGGVLAGSLSDYMGIPINIANLHFTSLWHRAYNLIWNEWFRDQNLQNSVNVPTDDGPDSYSDFVLLRRNKRPDYFATCLPWPQKGSEVRLPLGTSVPVSYSGTTAGGTISANDGNGTLRAFRADGYAHLNSSLTTGDPSFALKADLSAATAATINQEYPRHQAVPESSFEMPSLHCLSLRE